MTPREMPDRLAYLAACSSLFILTSGMKWQHQTRGKLGGKSFSISLLILHSFRFIGLAVLIPGVVSPDLPPAFAHPEAYGDMIAAILALSSLLLLPSRAGIAAAWIFNLWGTADLVNAFYQANHAGLLAGQLGAAFFLPTLIVPLLLITHGLVFRILMQRQAEPAMHEIRRPA